MTKSANIWMKKWSDSIWWGDNSWLGRNKYTYRNWNEPGMRWYEVRIWRESPVISSWRNPIPTCSRRCRLRLSGVWKPADTGVYTLPWPREGFPMSIRAKYSSEKGDSLAETPRRRHNALASCHDCTSRPPTRPDLGNRLDLSQTRRVLFIDCWKSIPFPPEKNIPSLWKIGRSRNGDYPHSCFLCKMVFLRGYSMFRTSWERKEVVS